MCARRWLGWWKHFPHSTQTKSPWRACVRDVPGCQWPRGADGGGERKPSLVCLMQPEGSYLPSGSSERARHRQGPEMAAVRCAAPSSWMLAQPSQALSTAHQANRSNTGWPDRAPELRGSKAGPVPSQYAGPQARGPASNTSPTGPIPMCPMLFPWSPKGTPGNEAQGRSTGLKFPSDPKRSQLCLEKGGDMLTHLTPFLLRCLEEKTNFHRMVAPQRPP